MMTYDSSMPLVGCMHSWCACVLVCACRVLVFQQFPSSEFSPPASADHRKRFAASTRTNRNINSPFCCRLNDTALVLVNTKSKNLLLLLLVCAQPFCVIFSSIRQRFVQLFSDIVSGVSVQSVTAIVIRTQVLFDDKHYTSDDVMIRMSKLLREILN